MDLQVSKKIALRKPGDNNKINNPTER
jgi:hypothetical protein